MRDSWRDDLIPTGDVFSTPTTANLVPMVVEQSSRGERSRLSHANSALEQNVTTPAIQSTGSAFLPRANSFNRSTRYPENAK